MDIFEHTQVAIPSDGVFKISPSKVANFFDYPPVWYKEQVLGEKTFEGNTATVLGTVCHYIFEKVSKGEDICRDVIDAMIDRAVFPDDVDKEAVKASYPEIATAVVNEYLLDNIPSHTEKAVSAHVKNGVYVAGTQDAVDMQRRVIVDYKIVGSKPNTDSIPFKYKIQLLCYVYANYVNNVHIDRIRIVYGVKPTKTLPARVFVVTEQVSQDDIKLISDTLQLIADTVIKAKEQPELIYLLFKSMSLK